MLSQRWYNAGFALFYEIETGFGGFDGQCNIWYSKMIREFFRIGAANLWNTIPI